MSEINPRIPTDSHGFFMGELRGRLSTIKSEQVWIFYENKYYFHKKLRHLRTSHFLWNDLGDKKSKICIYQDLDLGGFL